MIHDCVRVMTCYKILTGVNKPADRSYRPYASCGADATIARHSANTSTRQYHVSCTISVPSMMCIMVDTIVPYHIKG